MPGISVGNGTFFLQKLGPMKQARTQETIYNPSFFATDANQQNGSVHEVKATLH